MRREAAPGEHGRVGGSLIGRRAGVRRRGDSEHEKGATIAECLGDTRHLRTDAQRKVGGVKYFGGLLRGIGRVQFDIKGWVRPCDQHGCACDAPRRRMVQPHNARRVEPRVGPARTLGCAGVVNGRGADRTLCEGPVIGHLSERRGVECLVRESSGAVRSTVDDEHDLVGG